MDEYQVVSMGESPHGDEQHSSEEQLFFERDFSSLEAAVPNVFSQTVNTYAYDLNEAILNEAEQGIYGLDSSGHVTFVNAAAQQMTGWSLQDLKGRTQHSVVHHSHADGRHYAQHDCPIYQTLRDGVVQHRSDEVFWRKDGTSFPVAYTSTPVLQHGRPHGAVVTFTDLTARVRQERWQQSLSRALGCVRERTPLRKTFACILRAARVLVAMRIIPKPRRD